MKQELGEGGSFLTDVTLLSNICHNPQAFEDFIRKGAENPDKATLQV
jgi:hypothetical protein